MELTITFKNGVTKAYTLKTDTRFFCKWEPQIISVQNNIETAGRQFGTIWNDIKENGINNIASFSYTIGQTTFTCNYITGVVYEALYRMTYDEYLNFYVN